ncbi:outer membrane lipoprotein-sorting protein [Trichloromonas sp.]|uniref:outer membrane lipoprotein-sorting protein n=1 Tax=Trichloromonas sp. TaxID=3069249 RepID=UPI002A4524A9|nr:outer membrane lipoprotein-sorting protein [Trichloromonas sp.]
MKTRLKYFLVILSTVFFFLMLIASAMGSNDFGIDGRELALKVRDRENGDDFTAQGTMELIDKNSNRRERTFVLYRKDQGDLSKQVLRFLSPADIAGTAFLSTELNTKETEQLLFLPSLKRTRRIVSSQKATSFVNTDFTYEDMERRDVDLWEHKILAVEKIGQAECFVLESVPKEKTNTEYSLIKSWVIKDINVPIKVDYYDKKKRLFKEYRVTNLKNIQGVWTEMQVSMADLLSGHRTLMSNGDVAYNSGLNDDLFTERSLERW